MKKQKLRLVLLLGIVVTIMFSLPLVAEASDVKINAKNFPDANFRKAVKTAYPDLLNDGVLSDSDTKKILSLNVKGKDIESIAGIKHFTSLKNLNCSNNPIKELAPLPKSLTKLGCTDCELTRIEQLPPNLAYLYCMNNKITTLPTLPVSLVEINVSNNRLKKLNGTFKNVYNLFANDKRTSKATLSVSGVKTAKCKDCSVTKKLEIPKIQSVKLSYSKVKYNGKKKTPSVTVKDKYGQVLKKGTDYAVSYSSAKRSAVGKYSMTVTFKGNYKGSKKLWFSIVPKATT